MLSFLNLKELQANREGLTVELFFWASGAKCPWRDPEVILLIDGDLILETVVRSLICMVNIRTHSCQP